MVTSMHKPPPPKPNEYLMLTGEALRDITNNFILTEILMQCADYASHGLDTVYTGDLNSLAAFEVFQSSTYFADRSSLIARQLADNLTKLGLTVDIEPSSGKVIKISW